MFEFAYSVELMVSHPTLDPTIITRTLGLTPSLHSKSGDDLYEADGKPRGRKALLSCWFCQLHKRRALNARHTPLDSFLASWVEKLMPHSELFRRINEEGGEVCFRIAWLATRSYTTSVLTPKTLGECSRLGIRLEISVIVREPHGHNR